MCPNRFTCFAIGIIPNQFTTDIFELLCLQYSQRIFQPARLSHQGNTVFPVDLSLALEERDNPANCASRLHVLGICRMIAIDLYPIRTVNSLKVCHTLVDMFFRNLDYLIPVR